MKIWKNIIVNNIIVFTTDDESYKGSIILKTDWSMQNLINVTTTNIILVQ